MDKKIVCVFLVDYVAIGSPGIHFASLWLYYNVVQIGMITLKTP